MTYNEFKTAAYKYKYETAVETQTSRLSFGDLLEKSNALYNSFCQMGLLSKTVAVMTGNTADSLISIIACLRADITCKIMRAAGPALHIQKSLLYFGASAVIVSADDFLHIAPAIKNGGCNCAIVTGKPQNTSALSSVYSFDSLLKLNDYTTIEPTKNEGTASVQYPQCRLETELKIESVGERDGVFIGLPIYTAAGFDAVCKTLLNGKKCVFSSAPSKQFFNKKSVVFSLMFDGCDSFETDALFYKNTDAARIGTDIFFTDEFENSITDAVGYPCECVFDGSRIKICVFVPKDTDLGQVALSPLARALAAAAKDTFYRADCPKSVIFKKTN